MIPVVTAAEAAQMDARSDAPVDVLMDRAGLAVALAAVASGAGYGSRVSVLCGPGNNGGDGYVAARYLRRRGVDVRVEMLTSPRTEAASGAAARARMAGVPVHEMAPPRRSPDVVVDAVFGGGFRRGLPPQLAPWMKVGVPVVAVDVPSGLDPDTGEVAESAFLADRTVTFGALKPGHLAGADWCGEVEVVDIGLGDGEPTLMIVEDDDTTLPPRGRNDHKWSAGSVLVVGGQPGMVGAAVMAGRSALHFGAGAVGVASSQAEVVGGLAPELLAYDLRRVGEVLDKYDVVVVGPGLGDQGQAVRDVVSSARRVVVDADALRSVEELGGGAAELILTPHHGEFSRLSDDSPDAAGAVGLARRLGATVLVKGWPTLVTAGDTPWAVVSGGPELATIGTGDVLAGMIAALWARGASPLAAAFSAAHWHGVAAADLAQATTVTADELARHVGGWSGV